MITIIANDYLLQLQQMVNMERTIDAKKFHNAKLLLKLYKDVVWRTEENLRDLDSKVYSLGGRRLSELIDFLSIGFDTEIDRQRIEEKLCSIIETKYLVEIVDKALMKLKSYPDRGEQYFEIIYKQYIIKYSYGESDLLESLNMDRSTFYRRKREAINLIGIILWGYVLPALRELWATVDTHMTLDCD